MDPTENNPSPPPITTKDPNYPTDPNFRPANTILIVMGILVLLTGIGSIFQSLYSIFMPLIMQMAMALEPELSSEDKVFTFFFEPPFSLIFILSGISLLLSSVALVWLGIGSIMIKKWAAKILHAMGWLLIGLTIMTAIWFLTMIPVAMAGVDIANGPPFNLGFDLKGKNGVLFWGFYIFYLVLIVASYAIPGVLLVLFYGRKNVEMTTQYKNPQPSWTDKLSYKVLIYWLLCVSGILWAPYIFAVIPVLAKVGSISNPILWYVVYGVSMIITIILTIGVSKLAKWSWWGSIIYLSISLFISYFAFQLVDFSADTILSAEGLNYPELLESLRNYEDPSLSGPINVIEIIDHIVGKLEQASFLSGLVSIIALIGYLIYIRKDFFTGENPV